MSLPLFSKKIRPNFVPVPQNEGSKNIVHLKKKHLLFHDQLGDIDVQNDQSTKQHDNLNVKTQSLTPNYLLSVKLWDGFSWFILFKFRQPSIICLIRFLISTQFFILAWLQKRYLLHFPLSGMILSQTVSINNTLP